LYLGVPLMGAVSVRVTQASSHVEPLHSPLRVRNAPKTGPRYPGLRFSGLWISDPLYSKFGSFRGAQFILKPINYRKGGLTAQVLDKAEITVEFPAARTAPVTRPATSDFARMLRRLLLNYQVAAGWAAAAPAAKRAAVKAYPLKTTQTTLSFTVGDGHSGYNEGTIDENGMIRLRGSDIVRFLGSSPRIDRVALYASYKGELPTQTPQTDQIPDGVSEVPVARFDVNNNGILDTNDYLLAYVSSISDWMFDTTSHPHHYAYLIDHYDDYRHYWIAVKDTPGLSLAKTAPVSAPVQDTVTSFNGHLLLKKSVWPSLSQGASGGLEWAWTTLTYYMPSFSIENVVLPHADPSVACSVQVGTGYSVGSPSVGLTIGGSKVCSQCTQYGVFFPFSYSAGSSLVFSITANKSDTIELKQVEFKYVEKLDMTNQSSMTVFSPEDSGIVRYRLSGLPADLVYIVRIANADASISLVDTVRGGGAYEWTDTAGIGVRYYVCTQQAIGNSPSMTKMDSTSGSGFTVRDLRTVPFLDRIDYLIVTHPNFMVQAQKLARHKKNVGPFLNPRAISITDIYSQFSGGNTDPAALRNCLEYVRAHIASQFDTAFEYVVLMGLGHYDYRNIATRDTSFIPAAEFPGRCIEDYFVYLDPGDVPSLNSATPDCFLGRIPCRTAQDASLAVDKIIQMEDPTAADFGAWRNRMLLVADDDMQGTNPDPLGTEHLQSSELVDSIIEHLNPAIDMRKDYLFEYPWNAQHEKPEAKQALIDGINNGVAYVNYFGHGASNVLADEHIFMAEDVGNLQNNGQYPLFSAFSCSVGEFDLPGTKRSLAEYLVLAQKSGAIATVSATREAYASDNEKLAKNFFTFCFDTTDSAARTMGQALALAKAVVGDENEKVYSYLGDPSMELLRPARRVSFTIVDNAGTVLKDTLKALQQVTIRGTVLRKDGTIDAQFGSGGNAKIQLNLFNPAYVTTRKDNGPTQGVYYKMPGTPIFAGQTQIVNGAFNQHILLPKNVTFNTPGIRLMGYGWLSDDVALGSNSGFVFHGFSSAKISDTVGPAISVRPVYQGASATAAAASSTGASFTDKITAPLPLTIEIMLFDSSGIDAVSTGPDEGISFEVPGVVARTNIDHKFQFGQGDYRRGTANWTFDAGTMTPGSYTMNITAQDLLGNMAKRSVAFDVTAEEDLALYHVFTYPNPVAMGQSSSFYYDLSKTVTQTEADRVIVTIRLFTLSGRLVRVFKDAKRGELFDGRDTFGNRLSPGVYLYQVIAMDKLNQKVVKSGIEKLAINPPR
ncbi:MAG: C25 family cysteine peptidase, partial [Terracidiphilus sp.]